MPPLPRAMPGDGVPLNDDGYPYASTAAVASAAGAMVLVLFVVESAKERRKGTTQVTRTYA